MAVVTFPKHHFCADDVVPVFDEDGRYDGKGRIARLLPRDDAYLIDWGDGTQSERIIPRNVYALYMARK